MSYQREYYLANPQKYRDSNKKRYDADPAKHTIQNYKSQLKQRFGMTLEDYDRMLMEQNGKCFICDVHHTEAVRGKLNVDHCHTSGKVRGLLCFNCNTALGKFKDDIELLEKAIAYLKK